MSAGEALYFGGFLLASTQALEPSSWGLVGLGQMAAARARGVPAARATAGSVAMILMVLWSESTYVAFVTHLALLRPTASIAGPLLICNVDASRIRRPLPALR